MNIYVGNLSRDVTDKDLQEAFEAFGQVDKATVIMDKFSGESRGFGFVQMPDADEAKAAIEGMNDKEIVGRSVKVSEAKPKPANQRGGSGGGGGFGGGRGGPRGRSGGPRPGGGGRGGRPDGGGGRGGRPGGGGGGDKRY